jgi:PEGA domain-containing protein
MIKRSFPELGARILPLFFGIFFVAPALADPKDTAGENARADEYFRQGKAFVKEDRWEDARRAYLAGWQIKRGYDIAGNLGSVELELGLSRDAAAHLAYCIKSFPATGTATQLAYIKGRFEEARQRVAALAIQVNVDGAEVYVDGRSIGRSPFLDDVYIEPGARTLEVKLAGFAPSKREITAAKGSWQSVALVLRADASERGPSAAPGVPVVPGVVEEERSRTPYYVGGALGIAGIGAGIVGVVLSHTSATRADETFTQLKSSGGAGACLVAANKVPCDALDQAYRDKATFRTVGIVGFAAAGAAAGALITYALLGGSKPSSKDSSAIHVDIAAGAGMTGALVTGGF